MVCVVYIGVAPQVVGPVVTLCTDKGPRLTLRPLQEYRSFPAPTEGTYTRPETAMREGDVSGSTGCNTPRGGQGSGVPGLEVSGVCRGMCVCVCVCVCVWCMWCVCRCVWCVVCVVCVVYVVCVCRCVCV